MTNVVNMQSESDAKKAEVLMRVETLIESKVVTAAQIAKESGISTSSLSQVRKGTYPGDSKGVIEKLTNWLRLRDERTSSPAVNPGFIMTKTAEQIFADLTYAQVTESIVVIFGASGVGKSETTRHYKSKNNNVWMVTAAPSRSSLTECLYEIAMELGMDDAPRRKGPLSRMVRQRLKGSEGLVIIDEADHLDYPTLEELRILQEETRVGMVLVGNSKVYTQLTGGRRNEDFARLFSRIAKKRGVHRAKPVDVRAIAKAWNVHGEKEMPLMLQISERPGGLRLLTKTLKLAAMYAKNQPINERMIRTAFAELEANE